MDTTPRKRVKILTLHEHTAKKQREIASIVDANQSTVSRILKQAEPLAHWHPRGRKSVVGRERLQQEMTSGYCERVKRTQERRVIR